ncbi:MAG: arylsulfatase, partial [Novosphingobium sp.]
TDIATGFPGYDGEIPKATATIGEILRQNGYSTAFFGKHHNTPVSEITTAGPFDNWPVGLGFEYFYGFVASQTDMWTPILYRGTARVTAPKGEHLDKMLVDDAIAWLHNQKAVKPEKPFFMYFAPGTAHAPLQAPSEWIARFRGKFDKGWDALRETIFARQKADGVVPDLAVLTNRPDFISAWSDLSPEQKKTASRFMEVFAAQLAYQDYQFGRLVSELERMGEKDNTLIVFVEGDNGASSEGGADGTTNDFGYLLNGPEETDAWRASQRDTLGSATSHAHYPMGWAWAMNTPFRYFKRYASHLGGIRNGMVVSWPGHVRQPGAIRDQFTHLIDVTPTLLAAAKVAEPQVVNGVKQVPMQGASFLATLSDPSAPTRDVQYFEMLGNRALFSRGWMASTTPPSTSKNTQVKSQSLISPLDYQWELYDLTNDFSQSRDLAKTYPDKLRALRTLWDEEAGRNQVFPLDNSLNAARVGAETAARRPVQAHYSYWGEGVELERGVMAPLLSNSFILTADVDLTVAGATGVIAALGDQFGGWSFYLRDGVPILYEAYSDQPAHKYRIAGTQALASGRHSIGYKVAYQEDGAAAVAIEVDGARVAEGIFPHHINVVTQGEVFTISRDADSPVSPEYGDGKFPGTVLKVQIDFPEIAAGKAPNGGPAH